MQMITRPCPVCGSTDDSRIVAEANIDTSRLDEYAFASRKLPEYMHHRLLQCPACDLVYASPVPTAESLVQAYDEAAYDSGVEAQYASQSYACQLERIVAELPDRCGALDIGAGDGAFIERLLEMGFDEVVGVEPSAAPIAAASDRVRPLLRHDHFPCRDLPAGRFSLVSCFQTMEHLPEPLRMCQEALRLLKPSGALFLIGHNRLALSARLLGRRSPIFDVEHLQLFSPASACEMLRRAGFERVRCWAIGNRYPLHYWLKLFPLPTDLKRGLLGRLKRSALGRLPIALRAGNMAVVGFRAKNDTNARNGDTRV